MTVEDSVRHMLCMVLLLYLAISACHMQSLLLANLRFEAGQPFRGFMLQLSQGSPRALWLT